MEILELACKNCGSAINLADISTLTGIMSCKHCGAIYKIAPSASEAAASSQQRPEVPMPEKFKIEKQHDCLVISWRWFKAVHLFMVFFAISWNAFMVFWHVMAISSGEIMMSLFGLIHTAVGLGLIYFTLSGFLNRTTVSLSTGQLAIKHAPLPWPGTKTISTSDIQQIYTKEVITQGKNGTSRSYEVHAVLASTRASLRLLSGLDDVNQGLFLEQSMESYLGIFDAPVAGEVGRG